MKGLFKQNSTPEEEASPFDTFIEVLEIYDAMDQPGAQKKKITNPFALAKTLANSMSLSGDKEKKKEHVRFGPGSTYHYFSFYILNLSLGEIYESYKAFYKQFDYDDSLKIEKEEFFTLLDYFARPENMGKDKVLGSFKVLSPDDYSNYIKLAPQTKSKKLESDLKYAFFNSLKIKDKRQNSLVALEFVNYLRFFPVMFSYFAEFIRRRIDLRMANLEVLRGIDKNYDELPRNANSLYGKLKTLGVTLKRDAPPPLVTLKQLERMLILFRASYSDSFTNEQVKLILSELMQKIKKQADSGYSEVKPIKLTLNLLDWIAYRVSLHSSLASVMQKYAENEEEGGTPPKYVIFEEYTMWAAAYRYPRYNKEALESWFIRYAKKHIKIDPEISPESSEYQEVITKDLNKFLRKIFPHINKSLVEKLVAKFFPEKIGSDLKKTTIETLASWLYDLSWDLVYDRVKEIVTTIHEGVSKGMKKVLGKKEGGWFRKSTLNAHSSSFDKKNVPSDLSALMGSAMPIASDPINQSYRVEHPEGHQLLENVLGHPDTDKKGEELITPVGNNPQEAQSGRSSKQGWFKPGNNATGEGSKSKFAQQAEKNNQNLTTNSERAKEENSTPRRGSILNTDRKYDSQNAQNFLQQISDLDNSEDYELHQRFSKNKNTGRKPDIINSFFIIESFLEKFLLEGGKTKKDLKMESNPKPELKNEEEKDSDNEKDDSLTSRTFRTDQDNNTSRIEQTVPNSADPKPTHMKRIDLRPTIASTEPLAERKVHALPTRSSFLLGTPKALKSQSQVFQGLSSSQLKIAEFAQNSSRISDRQPVFTYNFDDPDQDDMNIEEIQFSRLERSSGRIVPVSNEKPRDQKGICGCSTCVIF